jgi:hypothetical protein
LNKRTVDREIRHREVALHWHPKMTDQTTSESPEIEKRRLSLVVFLNLRPCKNSNHSFGQ